MSEAGPSNAGPSKTGPSKAGPAKAMTRSKSASIPSLPDTFTPSTIADLKVGGLRDRLTDSKTLNDSATKPKLQALYILSLMGVAVPGKKVNEELLKKVTGWCKALVVALHDEVRGRELEISASANKWLCIESLVQEE